MSPEDTLPIEDSFASLLTACDEALGAGLVPNVAGASGPEALRRRLENGVACLRRLRRCWRPAAAPVVRQLGRFRVLQELGRGTFGVVFLAHDPQLGRPVALKVPRAEGLASPALQQRFLREARAAAALDHPNVVPVYEAGAAGPICYIASAYCPGPTLAAWLKGRSEPAPFRAAALLLAVLAEAVRHAHERGIVHRDLKPANILLQLEHTSPGTKAHGNQGRGGSAGAASGTSPLPPPSSSWLIHGFTPKITDFGLARVMTEGEAALTLSGSIVGTPAYMAPEQASGRGAEVGPGADIYALGAILYEVLTGRPPFQGETILDTLDQVRAQDPVPPSRLRPRCPPDLETICLKCLEKDPARRYLSAAALAADLACFLGDRPIRARRTGSLERLWRWRRRNPVLASLAAAVALLLLLLAIGSTVAAFWFRHQRQVAQESQKEAVANLDRALRAEAEGEEKLWHELLARARAGRFSQRTGQRFESLEALAQAARMARERHMTAERLERLRDLAIACLALPDIRVREWDGWPEGSVGLAFNAERGLYARTSAHGDVSVRRLDDDTELAHLAGAGVKVQPHFSLDGRVLLLRELEGGRAIHAWRPGAGSPFARVEETANLMDVQVSRDGSRFAVAHKDGSVHVFALPSGRRTVLPGGLAFHGMRLSPTGRWLAVSRLRALTLYDLEAGTSRVLEREPSSWWLWFGPGEKQLAVLAGGYNHPEMRFVRIFDLESGRLAGRLEHTDSIYAIAWHPNGKTLATGTFDSSLLTLWDVPTGSRLQTITSHKGGALQVCFNETGDLLLSYANWGGGCRLWHPTTGKLLLVSPEACFSAVQATSDGRLLALESAGRKLRLCEAYPGREYRTLVRDPAAAKDTVPLSLALHPGGRLLAAGLEDGLAFWDLDSGAEAAFLPLGKTVGVVYDGAGALWTGSSTGLRRWPVRAEPGAADHFRVGPPQTFPLPGSRGPISVSRDGRVAACPPDINRGAAVVHLDRPHEPLWLTPQYDVRGVSVSPDGRLVATGNYFLDPRSPKAWVKVWQADSGRLITTLPIAQGAFPYFSPDGRRLLINVAGGQARLFDVQTWREQLRIDGTNTTAFTPDGKLLSVETGTGVVRLIDVRDGHTVVRLEDPGQARSIPRTFSRDGSRLILGSSDERAIHVWDLRALRRQLAPLGLDWDADPYPPAPEDRPAAKRLRVSVESGDVR